MVQRRTDEDFDGQVLQQRGGELACGAAGVDGMGPPREESNSLWPSRFPEETPQSTRRRSQAVRIRDLLADPAVQRYADEDLEAQVLQRSGGAPFVCTAGFLDEGGKAVPQSST